MRYVDGFVIPVKKDRVAEYKKIAAEAGKVWMRYGALQYFECAGDDLKGASKWGCLPFPKMAKAKPNETIIFSFIVYKSRKHRDAVNAKVMKDPIMKPENQKAMPFDMKRMAVGGFKTIVDI
jgi:uncharacterized protein YbaA (DUF1428 family)